MFIHLLALMAFGLQTNPPGIPVVPSQAAFYSAAGATEVIELRNSQGLLVPFTDTAGVAYPHVTITIPSGTPVGLGWQITQTSPDGIHPLHNPSTAQYSVVIKMLSGTATESPVGTYDCSAGAGNGIASGLPAPDSGTPTVFATGVSYTISVGSVITCSLSSGYASVSDPGLPVNINPLSLALADIGGAGVTVGVEYRDSTGATIALVDTNGASWSAVTVTVGASAALGLSYGILNTKPDGTHAIAALPNAAAYVVIRCLTGTSAIPTLAINTGGLVTGASGTGATGFNIGYNPNASTPTQFYVGDFDRFGRTR